jgi:hypothetical protein
MLASDAILLNLSIMIVARIIHRMYLSWLYIRLLLRRGIRFSASLSAKKSKRIPKKHNNP